jgi:hypothetical protein
MSTVSRLRSALLLSALALAACAGEIAPPGGDDDGGGDDGDDVAGPTFHEDVAPILMANCVSCHSDDEANRPAPFALTSYEAAKEVGGAGILAFAVENRIMPPWKAVADGSCGDFEDEQWLEDDEIATIAAWVDAGMPEGDPANAPTVPAPPTGLGDGDLTLSMAMPYQPPSPISDDYRCFVLEPGLATDQFLTALEVRSDNPTVSHHAILFAIPDAAGAQEVRDRDAGEGYPCFGGPGPESAFWAGGWVPGQGAMVYPADTGIRLVADRPLVLQMHFNYTAGIEPAEVDVVMELADQVAKEGFVRAITEKDITLPGGMDHVEETNTQPMPATADVWGVLPHMHQLGSTLTLEDTDQPDGCVVDVRHWDFAWQRFYWFDGPRRMAKQDAMKITCGWDTSDVDGTTTHGEKTTDEMCMAFLYATVAAP